MSFYSKHCAARIKAVRQEPSDFGADIPNPTPALKEYGKWALLGGAVAIGLKAVGTSTLVAATGGFGVLAASAYFAKTAHNVTTT